MFRNLAARRRCSPRLCRKAILVFAPLFAFALPGCGAQKAATGGTSKLTITLPSEAGSRKVSSATVGWFSWSNACFIANVKLPETPPKTPDGACGIPIGVIGGSTGTGGSLDLTVPNGTGRSLEVLAFVRSSPAQTCPVLSGGLGGLNPSQIVRVGLSAPFDATGSDVTVDVTVALPGTATDIVAQYGLPASCRPANSPLAGSGGARIALGAVTQTGGTYVLRGTASWQSNEALLTGTGYQLKLTRKSQ